MRTMKAAPPAPRMSGMGGAGNFTYGGVPPPSMNFDGSGGGRMDGAGQTSSGNMGMTSSRPMGGPNRMSAASLLGDYMEGNGGNSSMNSLYNDYQGGYPHPSKRSKF